MNKNAIQKMMIAAIACIALCGTALAAPRVAAPDGRPAVGGYPAPHKGVVAKPMPKPAPQVAHHRAPFRHAAPRTTLAAADAVGYAQSICPATPCHRHHHCHGWRPAPPPPPPPCRWGRW